MRRLLNLVQSGRLDATPIFIHRFSLDEIPQACHLFGEGSDGVLKVAIKPQTAPFFGAADNIQLALARGSPGPSARGRTRRATAGRADRR